MRPRAILALLVLLACNQTDSTTASTLAPTGSPILDRPISAATPTTCWEAPAAAVGGDRFIEATESLGLVEPLLGMRGHAAAWGDVDGDGWLDLVVGTFAGASLETFQARGATGPSPDRLLFGGSQSFTAASSFLDEPARTSGAAFADFDGDSDLDLVLSRYPRDRAQGGTVLMDNQGGRFSVVAGSGLSIELAGRSVGVLDFDRDGLLDLLLVADPRGEGSSRLFHNQGDLRFDDVTNVAFTEGVVGLGVGTADLNGDSYTDVFVGGSNRLFIGTHEGVLREADSEVFGWESFGPEDDVAGVAIGDLNRDALPDLVVGHHYNSTLSRGSRVPIRVYLNDGIASGGDPRFTDITEESGMPGLATKAPHVEIADFDNDGWPDILATASAGDDPAIFRHEGLDGGLPRFSAPPGLGGAQYWVTGPTADVNRDGRIDVFLAEWDPALPSRMLLNEGLAGNWLSVEVDPAHGGGIGAKVAVYERSEGADPGSLLGLKEISASVGYAAGIPARAHFGLGAESSVDLRISLPDGQKYSLDDVPANRHLRLPNGCGTVP